MLKVVSWNVNGIRAVLKKGFSEYVSREAPDIICLQETKARPEQVELSLDGYPYRAWHAAEKPGYSGTAIFSRREPRRVSTGIGIASYDREGRTTTAEFDGYTVVSAYIPNAKDDLSRLADRQNWDREFLNWLIDMQKRQPLIVTGDFNVAHREIDLARPEQNVGEHGFTDEERAGFQRFLDAGFVDTFRALHPDATGQYTWWSYFSGARQRNIGWRIDYVLISAALRPRLREAFIRPEVTGSDHCPVGAVLDL
jgi:exodeoxyribonuclease-3